MLEMDSVFTQDGVPVIWHDVSSRGLYGPVRRLTVLEALYLSY